MKIHMDYDKNLNALVGKSLFFHKLGVALDRLYKDIEWVRDLRQPSDISLHIIRAPKQCVAKKKIIRLDGCWHNSSINWKAKNEGISSGLDDADAVVYQSDFSQRICEHYLGVRSIPKMIIHNGADPTFWVGIEPIKSKFQYNFLTASKWRPHKRLRDTIECFLLAAIPNACLYVAGDTSQSGLTKSEVNKYRQLSNVQFLGHLPQLELARYMKIADGFVHLCWTDNCPNSAVEAICAGVPVVCNNEGGTHEIVGPSNGFVCQIDAKYNLKPVELYSPPKIDRGIVAEAIRRCVFEKPQVRYDHVHIDAIAKQYYEFFQKVLSNG